MLYCSLKPLSRFYLLAVLFAAVFCCTSAAQSRPQGRTMAAQGRTQGQSMAAQGQTQGKTMVVRHDMHHDVSPPLRDLIKAAGPIPQIEREEEEEAEELKLIPLPSGFKPGHVPDRALQPPFAAAATPAAPTPLALTPGLNFDGIGQGTPPGFSPCCAPPDTNGAAGLTQYVQWVNLSFAVFDKTTGALLAGPTLGKTLWAGFGGGCETNNDGDPIVIYDKLADRWVFTQFVVRNPAGGFGPFFQCVAVSTTSDATGTFNRYSFPYTSFDDYPKMGVWPDAYYITFNMFNASGTAFLGTDACAYDRNAMLNGLAATQVCFQQAPTVGGVLPADVDGHTPPPAGSPNYMLEFAVNSLNLYKFHVDFATPGNSTFSPATNIPVQAFTPLCNGGRNCVPQTGTANKLDSLGDRLMYRLAYRNFGDHESLVVNHSVAIGPTAFSGSGVRWYEIQNPGGATPTVAQQSTFAPDASFRWMGSMAMDQVGDIAVGYSVSSSAMFPSIAIAARNSTDPPSTLQPEVSVISGTGSQTGALTRWGDYSAMQVDPVDDCTFWYTTEYLKVSGVFNWNTRIASFKFDGCDKPDLTLAVTHSGNFIQGQPGTYAINVKNSGGLPTDGSPVTVTNTLPAGFTASTASGTGWTCSLGPPISCNRSDVLDANTSYPAISVTVSVDANAAAIITNTASIAGGGEINTANDTASDTITVIQTGPDPSIAKSHIGSFIQGQTGTYTITVTNLGLTSLDATMVTVTDTLPAGLTATSIAGTGWSCTLAPLICTRSDALDSNLAYPSITLTVNVAANAPLGPAVNTATVSGGGDVNPLNDTATDTVTISPPPPDLSITKTHTVNFNQGQTKANYTLTVSNAVTANPTRGVVTVTDTVPTGLTPASAAGTGWSCSIGAPTVSCATSNVLLGGTSYPPITLSVNVANDAPASVVNTATVSGGGDLTPGNNTASDPTTINPSPDLTITKTHTPDPMVVGSTGTYTFTVSNVGNASTSGLVTDLVTVNDPLPVGMIATAVSGTGWVCSSSTSITGITTITCTRSDALAAGSSYPPISMTLSVTGGGPNVTNTANVKGGGEFNLANNTASDLTNITGPILAITKSHTGDFTVGQSGTYTIVVSNVGPVATIGPLTVGDRLPVGLTSTAVSGPGWSCTLGGCTRSDVLAPNSSYPPITWTVSVNGDAAANVVNTASVSGGGATSFAIATDPTNINLPDLTITKTHNGNFVFGQTGAVYTITVSNAGTIATAGGIVFVRDSMPGGLLATAVSGTGWTCSITLQAGNLSFVQCSRPDGALAPGSSYPPITLTVNVDSSVPSPVVNTASVSGIGDANLNNNTASDSATVVPAPVTTAVPSPAPNAAGWNSTNVLVSLSASAVGSGVSQITFSAKGAQTIAPTTVLGASASVSIASEGVTVFSYFATDNDGNVEPVKTLTVKIDETTPVTTAVPSPAPNAAGWNNTNVLVSLSASDGGSGVKQITFSASGAQPIASTTVLGASASVSIAGEGVTVISYFATDNAANVDAVKTLTVQLDKTAPTFSCGAPDGAWHASDVSFACTAGDGGSGLDANSPASFTLTSNVPAGTETAVAVTSSRTLCDVAGNCSVAGPIGPNQVDKKPPQIVINAPAAATYKLNQAVASSYSCTDGGSGVATCAGPVASGSNFDTASAGVKTFTVNSTDNVGNVSAQSVSYSVTSSTFAILAVSDSGTISRDGGVVLNALANDTFNGASATLAQVVLTLLSSTNAGLSINPGSGTVSVAAGTPAGNQTLVYNICEIASPLNCSSASVVITVTPYVIHAAADSGTATALANGTPVANVLANDTLGASPATLANVSLTQVSVTPVTKQVRLNLLTGAVEAKNKATAGTYGLVYQICEIGTPGNCSQATVTVILTPGAGGGGSEP